jgi:hypothetical protein
MSRTAGWCGVRTIGTLLLVCSVAEAGDPVTGDRLFRLTRNKNDNIVCYDVHHKAGKLEKKDPVSAYWVIPSKNNTLEGLNFLERTKAYGITIVKMFGQDSVDITLKAGKKLIRVTVRGTRWVALTTFDSCAVALDSIYVMADESGTMPTVQYVEFIGRILATGESLVRKLSP